MADIMLPKSVDPAAHTVSHGETGSTTLSNVAYAAFVLFCFWAGNQLVNLVIRAPGVLEHLAQGSSTARPRIEMGLAVSTLFGLVPFLLGCLFLGLIGFAVRLYHRQKNRTTL